MASTLVPLRSTTVIRSSAFPSGHRKPETRRSSNPHSGSSSSSSWWTPLFGWSSDPDYIDGGGKSHSTTRSSYDVDLEVSSSSSPSSSTRSKFALGGFTEEKAKQLRARTVETTNFHDKMYHSAIASRMASDRNGSVK